MLSLAKIVQWVATKELKIFCYVNQYLQCSFLDFLMPKITHLGGATVTISTLLLIMLLGDPSYQVWASHALLSLIISHLFVQGIKKGIPRPRPYLSIPKTRTFPNPLTDYSFPSGHSTAIFSVCSMFSLYAPLLSIFLIPLACIVSCSRMYLGLHYPTDCFIGAILGSITSLCIFFLGSV